MREKVRSIVGERRALREDDFPDLAFVVPFGDGVRRPYRGRNLRLRRFHVDVRQQIFLSYTRLCGSHGGSMTKINRRLQDNLL